MPSIHVKDGYAARYAILTGDREGFKDFVNDVVKKAINKKEEEAEMLKREGIKREG